MDFVKPAHPVRRAVAAHGRARCRLPRCRRGGVPAPRASPPRAGRARRGRAGRGPGRHRPDRHRPGRRSAAATPAASSAPEGTLVVDGPTVYLWGLILIFATRWRRALRRAQARGRGLGVRRPGGGAAGHRGRAPGLDQGPGPHRGLPAADVRRRRHDAVPDGRRPAHHVRRPRGAVAAALPALRARPPAAAAQPGGGAQVLPARRLLLRLLPLRRRADLRLRRLDGVRPDQRGDPQRHRQRRACC